MKKLFILMTSFFTVQMVLKRLFNENFFGNVVIFRIKSTKTNLLDNYVNFVASTKAQNTYFKIFVILFAVTFLFN